MIIEKDAQTMGYGMSSYTIFVEGNGEPNLKTLKITKSKRKKYGNK